MFKKIALLGAAFILLASTVVGFPTNTGLVTDAAHVLTQEQYNSLADKLRTFEKTNSIEFAVVTVPNLEGMDISLYRNKLFEEWKIGKKGKDNGILLVVGMAEHKVGIEVGYGLEGTLNDGLIGAIIRNDMIPNFRAGLPDMAVLKGVDSVIAVASKAPAEVTSPVSTKSTDDFPWLIIVPLVLVIVSGIGFLIWYLNKKQEEEARGFAGDFFANTPQPYIPYTEPSPTNYVYAPSITKSRRDDDNDYTPSSSYKSSSDNSSSSYSSSSPSFDFGGGSSGGGGADASW